MERRIAILQRRLKEEALEALLITHPVNRRYVTGFTGSAGVVLITPYETLLITDFRYISQVKEQAPHVTLVEHPAGEIYSTVSKECARRGIRSVAFEQDHLVFSGYQELRKVLMGIQVVPTSRLVESLRMIKDDDEMKIIRHAAYIADQAFAQVIQELRPGITEKSVASRLEWTMRELGATSSSFSIIVASGKRSALPHGIASDKVLEEGDLVTMDFGALYEGYASDITRTVMLGSYQPIQKKIYDIVLEAGNRAIAAIRPGMQARQADRVARDYITQHGYGEYFGHGTGHALGLEVHESPRLSPKDPTPLEPGMVVTVEPGIYLPDIGGVRIEDDILITENGCEVLTQSDKQWTVIG